MTTPLSPLWYVVRTHVHAENKAMLHLSRQGFRTYLPRYLKRRRHARRTEIVSAPLFPSYLFVAIDVARQRWRCIQSTFGVVGLIFNGDGPAAISSSVVDELKAQECDKGFIRLTPKRMFKPGDRVRIEDSAFASCVGLFDGMTGEERVNVLLDLLGRKVRVTLDADFVSAA